MNERLRAGELYLNGKCIDLCMQLVIKECAEPYLEENFPMLPIALNPYMW